VVKPFEVRLWKIKGIEYLYAMSRSGMGIITEGFLVGSTDGGVLGKLYNKVMSNPGPISRG
jgi:hypothetical protein